MMNGKTEGDNIHLTSQHLFITESFSLLIQNTEQCRVLNRVFKLPFVVRKSRASSSGTTRGTKSQEKNLADSYQYYHINFYTFIKS